MTLEISQALTSLGGILCEFFANGITWDAKYLLRCLEGSNLVGCYLQMEGEVEEPKVTSLQEVVLCKANEDPCKKGHMPTSTVLHAELAKGTSAVLLSEVTDQISCLNSTALGSTDRLLAHGLITELTFSNCHHEGEECVVITENLPYLIRGELKASNIGYEVLVTKHAESIGKPQASVSCPGLPTCAFGAATLLFEELTEASDTLLDILQTLTPLGGFLCTFFAGNSVWHAKYLPRCLQGSSLVACYLRMEEEEG